MIEDEYYYNEYDCNENNVLETTLCQDCKIKIEKCPNCEGIFEKTFFNDYHKEKCEKISERHKKAIWDGDKFEEEEDDLIVFENDELRKMCKVCNKTFTDYLFIEHKTKCEIIYKEKNLVTQTTECELCGEKISRVLIEEHHEKCRILKRREAIISQSGLKFTYPDQWNQEFIKNDEGLEPSLFKISMESKEFVFCETMFKASVPKVDITNIYRIQHKYLYEKYYLEKQRLIKEKGSTDEKWLFHGTRATEPRKIYMKGFDICFANQGMYGFGNYFALQAVYSYSSFAYHYGGKSYLFLCKVLTGKSFVSASKVFTKPPLLNEKLNIYYDSVTSVDHDTAVRLNQSQMYIVYENDKAYPFYIIEYNFGNGNIISNTITNNTIAFVKN